MIELYLLGLREKYLYGSWSPENINSRFEQRLELIDPLYLSCERREGPSQDSDSVAKPINFSGWRFHCYLILPPHHRRTLRSAERQQFSGRGGNTQA